MENLVELCGRIERLERANRRWRLAGAALIGLALIAAVPRPAITHFEKVSASKFLVLDSENRVRISLSAEEGFPKISLLDEASRCTHLITSAEGKMNAIVLKANGGKGDVSFGIGLDGEPFFYMTSKDGKPVGSLP